MRRVVLLVLILALTLTGCKIKTNQLVEIPVDSGKTEGNYQRTVDIDNAINDYITKKVAASGPNSKIFQAHELYGSEEKDNKTYAYLWTYYREFSYSINGVKEGGTGGSQPMVVVLMKDGQGGYYGVDVLMINDAEDYKQAISRLFPQKYHDKILSRNSVADLDPITRLKAQNYFDNLEERLSSIISNTPIPSQVNILPHIKDNGDFQYIVEQGELALSYLLVQFEKGSQNGLKEHIMALACAMILGEDLLKKDWTSGRQWYNQFQTERVAELQDGSILFYGNRISGENKLSIVVKSEEGKSIISNNLPSKPVVSPYSARVAYIEPWSWEEFGEVVVYNPLSKTKEVFIKKEDDGSQWSPKEIMWLDDRFMFVIIGPRYGTVSQGGKVHLLDTLTNAIYPFRENEERQEVSSITSNMKEVIMEVVFHNEDSTDFERKEEFFSWAEIYEEVRNIVDKTTTDSKVIAKILSEMKNQSMGVAGWETIYAGNNRIIIKSHSHLMLYDLTKGRITSIVDLMTIKGGHVQGSIVTNFSVSPNGRYVIINNGSIELDGEKNHGMYLCDLDKGTINLISEQNYFTIRDSWSPSSDYYVFAQIEGSRIMVYDVNNGNRRTINRTKGTVVDKVSVSNRGDVVIGTAGSLHIYTKGNNYTQEQSQLKGDVLGFVGEQLIYYHNGSVHLIKGKTSEKVNEIGLNYKVIRHKNRNIVFYDGTNTIVYNLDANKIYQYKNSIDHDQYLDVSPDGAKIATNYLLKYKVVHQDGKEQEFDFRNINGFSELFLKWLDNNTIILNLHKSFSLGDFAIMKYEVEKGSVSPIFEP